MMHKTHDYTYTTRGYWDWGVVCRIRIYEGTDPEYELLPIVICTETEQNKNTSITNIAEHLAAEIYLAHPRIFGTFEMAEIPREEHSPHFMWVEHYDRTALGDRGDESFDIVTFDHYEPLMSAEGIGRITVLDDGTTMLATGPRPAFGPPFWRRSTREEIEAYIDGGLD